MQRTKECKEYSIRDAVAEDVVDLVVLGKQFVKESNNQKLLGWSMKKVYDSLHNAIERDDLGVFVLCCGGETVGMLVCFIAPCFFSDALQAGELVWYVDPEHRGSRKSIEMLIVFEDWAKERGAVCCNMMNLEVLSPEKTAKFYTRRGYTLTENTFIKEL